MERVQSYADSMSRYAADTVQSWNDGQELALNDELSDLTLRILAHTLFDFDIEDDDQFGETVSEATTVINARAEGRTISNFLPQWVPTPSNRRYKRVIAEMRAMVEEFIEDRRGREDEYDDLLSLLLTASDEDSKTLSDVEIRDQMITFIGAGTETSSLALTYACLELAKRDDVRAKLEEEVSAVLDGEQPTLSDLPQLDYTERVLNETLRLYPPAYIMLREASRDVTIGGYHVPAGTKISVPQFYVHTDERWYDDPDEFRPERWTDDFEAELPDYAYFPFGGGPRHCIGMRFAMLELKHVLPIIVQHVDFDLLSDPDPDFAPGVTLQPAADVRVRVRK